MPKLLQINVTANWGSTGRIAEQISNLAANQGWETYIAYGRNGNPSNSKLIKTGSKLQVYEHYLEEKLFDNDGLASRCATRKLVREIDKIKPDLIHLHNIHGHWLNYKILFEYLSTLDTPVVWTLHDCWTFTGRCGHYEKFKCYKWRDEGCSKPCPLKQNSALRRITEKTQYHFELKKELFTSVKNLTLVPVSSWLENQVSQSYLKGQHIQTIHNGVNIQAFSPQEDPSSTLGKYGLLGKRYVLAVSSVWNEQKGLIDYCKLAPKLKDVATLVLLGLNDELRDKVKEYGILGIPRTENIKELADLYSGAGIVLNLSYGESFGLTTVEGYACGTPSIVYRATASPELITPDTGIVCEPGDINAVADAVRKLLAIDKPVAECRELAEREYDQQKIYSQYVSLYNKLILERL